MRNEPLDHVLFDCNFGLGKTTLAHIIANEMGGDLTVTSGPALEKGGDLIGILTHLSEGDVLFVDEIHAVLQDRGGVSRIRPWRTSPWTLCSTKAHARSHCFRLGQFTLVGATTRVGLLSSPLRDRFGISEAWIFIAR